MNSTGLPPPSGDGSRQVCKVINNLYQYIAELSQWTIAMQNAPSRPGVDLEGHILHLHKRLETLWYRTCTFEGQPTQHASLQLTNIESSLYTCVILEYEGTRLHLLTSIYLGQHLSPDYDHKLVARLCTSILAVMREIVTTNQVENYRLKPLFLAGCATQKEEERKLALDLYRVMDGSPASCNAKCGKKVMEQVHSAQRSRVASGGRAEDIDWKDFISSEAVGSFTYFYI